MVKNDVPVNHLDRKVKGFSSLKSWKSAQKSSQWPLCAYFTWSL